MAWERVRRAMNSTKFEEIHEEVYGGEELTLIQKIIQRVNAKFKNETE